MSSATVDKNKIWEVMSVVIMFALFFGVQYLPPFGQITPFGMKILGVFLGLVWGWIFVDIIWTSVLGFFVLGLTGWTSPIMAVVSGFSNPTIAMIVFSFAFAYCLSKIGVNETIAYWVLGRKVFANRPWLLITALVLTAHVISIAGGGLAAIFMFWGIVYTIAEMNGLPKNSLIVSMLVAMILYAGCAGNNLVPFMTTFLMFGGFFTNATGIVVDGLPVLLAGQLYVLISEILLILVVKFIFRADASAFSITAEKCAEYAEYKNSRIQIIGLIATVVFFMGLLLPSVFKGAIWTMFASWGLVGWAIIYMVFFNLLKDENGKPVCTVIDCFTKGMNWAPILLFMVTIPLADAMESEQVGILATINVWCNEIFAGLDLIVFYAAVAIIIGFLTQLLHNIVVGAIFIPVLTPIVIGMGGNPVTFFLIIYCALCCSFATPAASMQASLIFGNTDVPSKYSYMAGFAYYIVSTITLIALIPVFDALLAGFMV